MGYSDRHLGLDRTLEAIEDDILPGLAVMLEALLDAAASGRSGTDMEAQAAELRMVALELEALTRQVEALAPAADQPPPDA
jgi:hypothetical protein